MTGHLSLEFLSPKALARRWGMHVGTLANWRTAGTGPGFTRIGDLIRYPLADVLAFEAEGYVAAGTAAS